MIDLKPRFFFQILLLLVTTSFSHAEFPVRTLHESHDDSKAVLRVHAEQRSLYPISRYLTGKFAEHLGSNIYKGMDAQVLENPTMAQYPFWAGGHDPDGVARFTIEDDVIGEGIKQTALNDGWPEAEIDDLLQDRKQALATFWERVGSREEVSPSPDTGPMGGRAQRLEVKEPDQGMAQWTYLPIHRVRTYEFEIFLRSPEIKSFSVALSQAGTKKLLASAQIKGVSGKWQKFTGTLKLDSAFSADEPCKFSFTADSAGQFVVQRILLRPSNHLHGADPEIVQYLKESRLPILRWPGGNFVSAYHWRDGVGPIEQRPTLPNFAWGRLEPNLFGTDEFMAFCKAVGCEPMICVNGGTGTPEEAAAWIEYCNGPVSSPMGKLRAANGHPAPYNVKHWEAGNELWGKWQVNWTTPAGNADRYVQFAKVMRAADSRIKLYGCGAPALSVRNWNDTLVATAGERLEGITDHLLAGGSVDPSVEPLEVYRDYMGIPEMLEQRWRNLEQAMSEHGVKSPRLALTELQIYPALGKRADASLPARLHYGNLVNPTTQAEALYDVLIYHTAIRLSPFFELITHSGTVNHGGGLKKHHEHVYANPCHYAQSTFAAMAGATPVAVEIECPMEKSPIVLPDLQHAEEHAIFGVIDAIAAVSSDALWLSIVQRKSSGPIDVSIELGGTEVADKAEVRTLTAEFPWSSNSSAAPHEISPVDSSVAVRDGRLHLKLEAYSVVRVRIPTRIQ